MAFLRGASNPRDAVPPEFASTRGGRFSFARPANLDRRILRAMFICCVSFAGLAARGQVAQEYDLKAAFLCKFALFVEWPTNAFPDAKTPITIGVLGSDPFGKRLDEVVRNEIVQKRRLDVESYSSVEGIIKLAEEKNKICHILFVSQSESGKLGRIFAGLKGRHILTVGESDRFCQSGGIIQFVMVENKVRFIINQDAAKAAKIKLSAALLDLAEKNRKR